MTNPIEEQRRDMPDVCLENGFRDVGIYIGLDEDEYLADNAIGGSGIKSMIFEPEEWWWNSPFNTFKTQIEDKRTDGKDFGSALHKMLLEGVSEYEACFALGFDKSAHPDALDTVADIKKAMSELELKTTGNKPDLIARLREEDSDVQILAELEAAHKAKIEDRKIISPEWDKAIRMMKQIATSDPVISDLFSEGVPEVSVFWRDATGAPCRARFDWLRIDKTCDLKSYAGRMGRHRSDNLVNAVMNYRYDLQEAHYRMGRKAMKGLPVHGGTEAQRAYLERCVEADNAGFSFVFAKTQGAPFIEEVRMDDFIIGPADTDRTRALEGWKRYFDVFGLSEPWITPSTTRDLNATDFPAYFGLAAVA